MKKNTIKTKHVYSEKKQNTIYLKQKNEKWFPINFQWIPGVKLNNELNIKKTMVQLANTDNNQYKHQFKKFNHGKTILQSRKYKIGHNYGK